MILISKPKFTIQSGQKKHQNLKLHRFDGKFWHWFQYHNLPVNLGSLEFVKEIFCPNSMVNHEWNISHYGEIPHINTFGYSYESMITRERSWCSRRFKYLTLRWNISHDGEISQIKVKYLKLRWNISHDGEISHIKVNNKYFTWWWNISHKGFGTRMEKVWLLGSGADAHASKNGNYAILANI